MEWDVVAFAWECADRAEAHAQKSDSCTADKYAADAAVCASKAVRGHPALAVGYAEDAAVAAVAAVGYAEDAAAYAAVAAERQWQSDRLLEIAGL